MRELARLAPGLRRAVEEAFADVASAADVSQIIAAIERGDIEAVMALLNLGDEYTGPVSRAVDGIFYAGGAYTMSRLPRGRVGRAGPTLPGRTGEPGVPMLRVKFDGRHPRAEQWVRMRAADMIQGISESQRRAIAEVIEAGIREGRNPKSIALDLVGRIRGNQRVGGMIGLTGRQAETLMRRREKLLAKGLSLNEVDKQISIDTTRALRSRAETIARTETISALNAGRYEGIGQLIDSGKVEAAAVTIKWSATMDKRTRDTHATLNGKTVRYGEAFVSETGGRMRFPGDRTLGAGAADVINCRCYAFIEVNFLAMAA